MSSDNLTTKKICLFIFFTRKYDTKKKKNKTITRIKNKRKILRNIFTDTL